MVERLKAAIEALGSDNIISREKQRTDELGLRVDGAGNFQGFGDYMHAKVNKLNHQVHSNVIKKSDIFKGISFYIDGFTHPPANEIRELVVENGGEYHHYYKYGTTTYVVAESLANTKKERLRKDEKVIKPNFITDSVKVGKLLSETNYFLISNPTNSNHVNEFFNRSRLHLISTMATELKKFVAELKKNKDSHEFEGREKLKHLQSSIKLTEPIICHIDMDCFFVSVALRTRPDLIGKPVAVTHSSSNGSAYGEIASCSYEARAKGCYARQFVRDALKLCPNLICVPYQFDEYVAVAKQLYSIISSYTLQIKAMSCDELFFDLSNICQECNISDPLAVIAIIRNDIQEQTQCSASAGLGPNSLIARMATKKAKPKGQFYVTQEEAQDFIADMPISDLPTIGWSTCENIQEHFGANIKLCRQLLDFSIEELRKVLGFTNGEKVYKALRGKCEAINFDDILMDQKSVSVNVNFGIRLQAESNLKELLKSISTELSQRLNQINKTGTLLTLKLLIRQPDAPLIPDKYGAHGPCYPLRKSARIQQTSDVEIIYSSVMKMIRELKPVVTDIRGVALHMTKLITFAPGRIMASSASSSTAKGTTGTGTLWDFMKTKNVIKSINGNTETDLSAFEWVPRAKLPRKKKSKQQKGKKFDEPYFIPSTINDWSPVKEQDEMRMKISDVCKTVPYQTIPARPLGVLPQPPERREINFGNISHRQISSEIISICGVQLKFNQPPRKKDYRKLLFHFKTYISFFQISRLKKAFQIWVKYVSKNNFSEEWKPLIDAAKKYLNWYCFNYHRQKVFLIEENSEADDVAKEEEEEFANFVRDILNEIEPKKERGQSPDIFNFSNGERIFQSVVSQPEKGCKTPEEIITLQSSESEEKSIQECEIINSKTNNEFLPGPSSSKPQNTVSKPKKSTGPPIPISIESSKSKNEKTAKIRKSLDSIEKRKQPALEDCWNKPQIVRKKKKLFSNKNSKTQIIDVDDDDECLIIDSQPPLVISVD